MGNDKQQLPTSSQTAAEPVLDLQSAIERLGSETLLKKVAKVFRTNAATHMSDMRHAISTGDNKMLEMAAHTLVSSMAYLSAKAASSAALKLEHMGRDGGTDYAEEAYEALAAEIERLEAALNPLLDD